jgi:hypothetical protein
MNKLQTVLDVLESLQRYDGTLTGAQVTEAIEIVQKMMYAEPVAYLDKYGELFSEVETVLPTDTPLYTAPQAVPADIPTEVTEVAQIAIAAMLKEYKHPSIPSNAARAGWRACRLYLTSIKDAK